MMMMMMIKKCLAQEDNAVTGDQLGVQPASLDLESSMLTVLLGNSHKCV